jgi:hypothetical protein
MTLQCYYQETREYAPSKALARAAPERPMGDPGYLYEEVPPHRSVAMG